MFGSSILEVAIGVVLVYFITSLLCTTITEWISRLFAMRSRTLKDGVARLFNITEKTKSKSVVPNNLQTQIYNHPLIKSISSKEKSWFFDKPLKEYGPSEIPARVFSQALIDIVAGSPAPAPIPSPSATPPTTPVPAPGVVPAAPPASTAFVNTMIQNIGSMNDKDATKQVLTTLLNSAITEAGKDENVLTKFRTSVEKWFDDSMERVTGWYKRKTQVIVLVLALAICFGFNVDTFGIANTLFNDANLRASMVAAAEAQVNTPVAENVTPELVKEVTSLTLPVGWSTDNSTPSKAANSRPTTRPGWVVKFFGILVSGFAISLGSGFWFDILSKLVNLRAAGKKPATPDEEAAAAAKK